MTTRRFIDGKELTIEHPWGELAPAVSVGVVTVDGAEIEVYWGDPVHLAFFLKLTQSSLSTEMSLPSGAALEFGRVGGIPSQGFVFALQLDDGHVVYGHTPPMFSESQIPAIADRHGQSAKFAPWSPGRSRSILQTLPGQGLCDIRLKVAPKTVGRNGLRTVGGTLSKDSTIRDSKTVNWLVLETTEFVTYFMPGGNDIDQFTLDVGQVVLSSR